MEHIEIAVEGMTCGGCVSSVQNALRRRPGVLQATANLDGGLVTVEFDPSLITRSGLEAAITDAGFEVPGRDQP